MHAFAQKGPEYLAWGTFEASSEEPGGLEFVGSQRVRQACAHMPREERGHFCFASPVLRGRASVPRSSSTVDATLCCHRSSELPLPDVPTSDSPPLPPPTVLSPREKQEVLRPHCTPGPCLLCPSPESPYTQGPWGVGCWSDGGAEGLESLSPFTPSSRGPSAKAFSSSTCFLH